MADHEGHLGTLRDVLVERRRAAATSAAVLFNRNGDIDEADKALAKVLARQADIEVIERAIADEVARRPSVYEKRGLLGA